MQADRAVLEYTSRSAVIEDAVASLLGHLVLTWPSLASRLDDISLSYNGGKDCLVLLILYLCTLATNPRQPTPSSELKGRLQSVYIVPIHPFPEVDAFVRRTSESYHLDLTRYPAPMRTAFEDYLRDRPRIKAVLVGTRRTDPHGEHLTHFDRTDGGWPPFMRVHPIIDWHYAEIWAVSLHSR